MEPKDVLKKIREENNLTQEEFAERVLVTRQAVSRWETGETQPNTETLKILSREFNVSINTLLGSPRQLYCQCLSSESHPSYCARLSLSDKFSGFGMCSMRKSKRSSFVS